MFRKLIVYAMPAVALILVAGFTIRTAFATPAVVPIVDRAYDNVERIRSEFPVSISADRSYDEVERNRSNYASTSAVDTSYDEVERNRSNYPLTGAGAGEFGPESKLWDYALRHPGLTQAAGPDLSDYALRHPELTKPVAPDLTDWFLRHRDEAVK